VGVAPLKSKAIRHPPPSTLDVKFELTVTVTVVALATDTSSPDVPAAPAGFSS
jgi:hypothetical protein